MALLERVNQIWELRTVSPSPLDCMKVVVYRSSHLFETLSDALIVHTAVHCLIWITCARYFVHCRERVHTAKISYVSRKCDVVCNP